MFVDINDKQWLFDDFLGDYTTLLHLGVLKLG